jgi:CubicO group peptidase (beta-lactamase class C family)
MMQQLQMRRLVLFIVAFAAVLALRAPARAQDLAFDRFGAYLDALRTQAGIPGLAAAIIGNQDIVWERPFGRQDVERAIATRTDTPFHLDGVTQVLTASLVLRCVEDGHLSLDDRLNQFSPGGSEATATLREILAHTSSAPVFTYRPERIELLGPAVVACSGTSFREKLADGLSWAAMMDSVPGEDVVQLTPSSTGGFSAPTLERYGRVLSRLAAPYAVDQKGRPSLSRYAAATVTPAGGVVSTVRDVAKFALALRKGLIVRPEMLAQAWRPPVGPDGQHLPHGLGWFVQSYNGETVVWQFGVGEGASSSLIVTVPGRGLTLVLLANSDGLSWGFRLADGDLTVSPFGRLFLGLFVR